MKPGSINLLETSGPVQACNGIALPLPLPLPYVCPCALKKKRSSRILGSVEWHFITDVPA